MLQICTKLIWGFITGQGFLNVEIKLDKPSDKLIRRIKPESESDPDFLWFDV